MSADLFGYPGHNNIEISDVRRIVDKLDANLSHYEKSERSRRIQAVEEAARLKQHNDHLEVHRSISSLCNESVVELISALLSVCCP